MSKPPSLKQLAIAVTKKIIDTFERELAAADPGRVYQKDAARLRLHGWIELVSNIPMEKIERAITGGEWMVVDGNDYLPSDLRIVKEYRNAAAAAPLMDAHDRRKCDVPFEKLFDPSLFPKLDYAEVREHSIVLGKNNRVHVGDAGPKHYELHDGIEKANNKAQNEAYDAYVASEKQRKRLFRKHPECKTTDALMRKLGQWAGAA